MENTIKLLVSIAEELDKKNLPTLADRIDTVASNVMSVKTAQYVGTQGYAIRNSRCFSNCYRKKRMQTPTKSAQEVWFDCHKEYIEALNDDNTTWNKYAEGDTVVKTASALSEHFVEIDKMVIASIDQKIKKGVDYGTAIFSSLEEVSNKDFDKVISSSEELLNVATELLTDPELAIKLSEAAEVLVKEAGPMDFFRGLGQGVKNWSANTQFIGKIKAKSGQFRVAIQEFDQNYQKTLGSFEKINGLLGAFRGELDAVAADNQATAKQKQYAAAALQGMTSLPQNAQMTGRGMQSYRRGLDDFMNALGGVLGGNVNAPQQPNTNNPQQPNAGAVNGGAPSSGGVNQQGNPSQVGSPVPNAQPFSGGGYSRPQPAIFNYLSNMQPGQLRALMNDIQTNKSFGSAKDYLTKEAQAAAPMAPAAAPAANPAATQPQSKPYNLIFHPKPNKNAPSDANMNSKGIPQGILQYLEGLTREQGEALISDIESLKKGF